MQFIYFISLLLITSSPLFAQQPTSFSSRGVGGGGAFYTPSFNTTNSADYYVSSDMTGVYHYLGTSLGYSLTPHTQLQGGRFSVVRFTNIASTRYALNFKPLGNIAQSRIAKTTDTGATWLNITTNLDPTNSLYSLFVDYTNSSRIVVSDYSHVYYSVNGGVTFNTVYTTPNTTGGCIVSCAMFNGTTILVGTSDGLLKSSDNGASFAIETHTGIPATQRIMSFCMGKVSGVIRMFCLTANDADVYVGINSDATSYRNTAKGVYKLDYTATAAWTSISTGLNFTTDFPMHISCAETDNTYCWLAGGSSVGEPRVWRSTDAGATWASVFKTTNNQNITPGWCGTGCDRNWTYGETVLGFSVAPRDKYTAIISDLGFLHRTADGGGSWRQVYTPNDNIHIATGIGPAGYEYPNFGLENTTCWQIFWLNPLSMYAAFSDIKALRSVDSGAKWSFNYSNLGTTNTTYRFARANNGSAIYAATSGVHDLYQSTRLQDAKLDVVDNSGTVHFSTDAGATWQLMHNFAHPVFWIATDPNNVERMYASVVHSTQGGVFVTNNRSAGTASTWTKLSNPPRTEGHPASLVVLNDGKLLATYSGRRNAAGAFTASSGCFLYDPVTSTWSDKSDAGMQYWCKDVVIDPSDATQNTWYVGVFSGWGGAPNGLGGLYKTTNRGTTWTRVWNEDRVTSITFHPQDYKIAYLTTETNGLWYSSSMNTAAPTFAQVTAYPFRQPERVFFNPYNGSEMWVTSFGAGMFKADATLVNTENIAAATLPIKAFPNPTIDICQIELPELNGKNAEIHIFNTAGQLISYFTATQNDISFSTKNWSEGHYFIHVKIGENQFQSHIMKK